jgi:hypothetical protein
MSGGIAQLVERLVRNEKARGSNPLTSTRKGMMNFSSIDSLAPARLALSGYVDA